MTIEKKWIGPEAGQQSGGSDQGSTFAQDPGKSEKGNAADEHILPEMWSQPRPKGDEARNDVRFLKCDVQSMQCNLFELGMEVPMQNAVDEMPSTRTRPESECRKAQGENSSKPNGEELRY